MKSFTFSFVILYALLFGQPLFGAEIRARLYIFGAPWCLNCKTNIPLLERGLKDKLGDKLTEITARVYLTSGATPSVPPNEKVCSEFAETLPTSFEVVPDPWRLKTYRKYFPSGAIVFPSYVILSAAGDVVKASHSGQMSTDEVLDVVAHLLE